MAVVESFESCRSLWSPHLVTVLHGSFTDLHEAPTARPRLYKSVRLPLVLTAVRIIFTPVKGVKAHKPSFQDFFHFP
jgi:hypothetical protein